jgi:transcriptional regulator with XRE-family HTH domain
MGYRGKLPEQRRARELRAQAWTLLEIAEELGVSKSSVSLWVRDVEFAARPRRKTAARSQGPNKLRARKLAQIEHYDERGRERLRSLDEQAFLTAGVALYAGEGAKTDGRVRLANTDPDIIRFFCDWLRRFFSIDESRFRGYLYLHEGLDLEAASEHWAEIAGIPLSQFRKPYRAVPRSDLDSGKHPMGCFTVAYGCSATHREIMGLVRALFAPPTGVAGRADGHGQTPVSLLDSRSVIPR